MINFYAFFFLFFYFALKTEVNASFLRAARAGNLEKVVEYLKENIDINVSNTVSHPPLVTFRLFVTVMGLIRWDIWRDFKNDMTLLIKIIDPNAEKINILTKYGPILISQTKIQSLL